MENDRDEEDNMDEYAWDDVNNVELPIEQLREARKEEMKGRTFKVVEKSQACGVVGTRSIRSKWTETHNSRYMSEMLVRSRWVARDLMSKSEKGREDLFRATSPAELIGYSILRQATKRADGRERKTLHSDVRNVPCGSKCTQDVFKEMPAVAEVDKDECGKLIYWLSGCHPVELSWEEHRSRVLDIEFQEVAVLPSCIAPSRAEPYMTILCSLEWADNFVLAVFDEKYGRASRTARTTRGRWTRWAGRFGGTD